MLTTYFVNTLDDGPVDLQPDGIVTLREALDAANRNEQRGDAAPGTDVDVIRFEPSLFDSVTPGSPAEIDVFAQFDVEGRTFIFGPGSDKLRLDAGGELHRIYATDFDSSVLISGMEVTGGGFGGIVNRGDLTLVDMIVRDNTTIINPGGGITNFGTSLTIDHSVISENTATGNGGGVATDGGVLRITNSTIFGNNAGGDGGGLFINDSSTVLDRPDVELVNVTISTNVAEVNGGGIALRAGDLDIFHGTITGNSSDFDADGDGDGGGIHVPGSRLFMTSTIVAGNFKGNLDTEVPSDLNGLLDPDASHANLIGDPNSASILLDRNDPGVGPRAGNIIGDGQGGVLPIDDILNPVIQTTFGRPVHTLGIDSVAIDQGLPTYEPLIAVDNAKFHYRFSERGEGIVVDPSIGDIRIADSTPIGRSLDAFIEGSPDLDVAGPTPNLGSAIRFDGTDDRVLTNPVSVDDFTISMWINPSGLGLIGDEWFEGSTLIGNFAPDGFGLSVGTGRLLFGVGSPDPSSTTIVSDEFVSDGRWRHIAVTRDGTTGRMIMYLDGIIHRFADGPIGPRTSRGLVLGNQLGTDEFYRGMMDEVAIFDGVLSASQVRQQFVSANLPVNDQRGFPFRRAVFEQTPFDLRFGAPDVGAFERQPPGSEVATNVFEVSTIVDESDGDFTPGDLSLREAIELANRSPDHNRIIFSEDLAPDLNPDDTVAAQTIELQLGDLFIEFDVTIDGLGPEQITVDQQTPNVPTFVIEQTAMVDLTGLRLTGADESAIINVGHLTLENVVMEGNGSDSASGGAMQNLGRVEVFDSRFENNEAKFGGAIHNGPAIDTGMVPTVIVHPGVEFRNNTATDAGGAIRNVGRMELDGVIISNNRAVSIFGGGIHNVGSAELSIRRSQITGNVASTGGGILSNATLDIFGSVISANRGGTSGGGVRITGGFGTISSSEIHNNRGPEGAGIHISGGVSDVINSTIHDNLSIGTSAQGAGVFVSEGVATFEHNTIAENEVLTIVPSLDAVEGIGDRGAGISISGFTGGRVNLRSNIIGANGQNAQLEGDDLLIRAGVRANDMLVSGNGQILAAENNLVQIASGVPANDARFSANCGLTGPTGTESCKGIDPMIDDFALNNGGPTRTFKLRVGSPAIDRSTLDRLVDQRGFPVIDQIGLGNANMASDIGAYESEPILIDFFDSTTASFDVENPTFDDKDAQNGNTVSQFVEGSGQVRFGVGYDDGRPDSQIPSEPGFLGFRFDPDPYSFGGIEEGLLGDRYGAEVTLDFGGRAGVEYGYLLDAGSVGIDYDGMFRFLSSETSANTFEIQTASFVEDGNLFTQSPTVGAYVDLVFELNASISGTGCLIACTDPFELPINLEKTIPIFSINRQQMDDLDGDGEEDDPVIVNGAPVLDGEIMFGSGSLGELLADDDGGAAESFLGELNDIRKERSMAEMEMAQAEQDLRRNPNDQNAKNRRDSARDRAAKADADEKKKSKKKDDDGGDDLCVGKFVTACLGAASDGLLGVEATLGVGAAAGSVSVNKPIGSVQVTVPNVALSDTELDDTAGTLSATTDDFEFGSIEDSNRQIAKLSVDVAGVLGPILGIPAGRYEAELGDVLSVSLQTISYDVQPRLLASQDVQAVPFFQTNEQLNRADDEDKRGARFIFHAPGNPSQRVNVDVSVDGGPTVNADQVWFSPGSTLTVSSSEPVEVTPEVRLGHRFSNDIGLEIDVKGILEALAINVEVFGKEIVDIGPLIRYEHQIGDFDLGSVFTTETPLNLSTSIDTLDSFVLGEPIDVVMDGNTPGGALPLEYGISSLFISGTVEPQETKFFSLSTTTMMDEGGDVPSVLALEQLDFEILSFNQPQLSIIVAQDGITLIDGDTPDAPRIALEPGQFTPITNSGNWSLEGFDTRFGDGRTIFGLTNDGGAQAILRTLGSFADLTFENGQLIDSDRLEEVNNNNLPDGQILNPFLTDGVAPGQFDPLDIDEDQFVSVQSDLVFIQQFINGMSLSLDLVGDNAGRTTEPQLVAKLEALEASGTLDADNDGNVDATDAALISMFFFGQRENLMDPQDESTVDELIRALRGSTVSTGINNQAERAARLAAEQGLQMTRTAGDDFLGIRTSNEAVDRVGAFEVAEEALLGASPWKPYDLVPAGDNPAAELANFGASIQVEDIVVSVPDGMTGNVPGMPGAMVVASSTTGTPPRLMTTVEVLADLARTRDEEEIADVPIPGLDTRETSRMTRSAVLGQDPLAPIFFRLPDAGAWDVMIPDGVLITDVVFDTNVGGNRYLNHDPRLDGYNTDFDIFIPETGQRIEMSMDRGEDGFARLSDLGVGPVSRFLIYPRALPTATLQRIDNMERPEIDLIVGLVLDDSQALAPGEPPIVIAEQLYAAEDLITPNGIVADPDTATDFRLERNDLAIDIEGASTSRLGVIVDNVGREFTIGDDDELVSSVFPQNVFPTSSIAKIEILGSSQTDTLRFGNDDLPLYTPIEFDAGEGFLDTIGPGAGLDIDLTSQITIRNVEVVELLAPGTNTLIVDAQSIYNNNPGERSLIVDSKAEDQVMVIGEGWTRRDQREDINFGTLFDVWEFNNGIDAHLAGVLLFVNTGILTN